VASTRENTSRILVGKPLQIDNWEQKDGPVDEMDVTEIISK
jgi:hypothetical protein